MEKWQTQSRCCLGWWVEWIQGTMSRHTFNCVKHFVSSSHVVVNADVVSELLFHVRLLAMFPCNKYL